MEGTFRVREAERKASGGEDARGVRWLQALLAAVSYLAGQEAPQLHLGDALSRGFGVVWLDPPAIGALSLPFFGGRVPLK